MSLVPQAPMPPILAALDTVTEALGQAAGFDPGFLRTGDKKAALRRLQQVEAQLAGLRLRVTAEAADVAAEVGAPSVAAWERAELQNDLGAARRREHLAHDLVGTWSATGDALADGAISMEQAAVIRAALRDLPDGLEPELLGKAESTLLDYAKHHTPRELRHLGRKILEVIAPDEHDRREAEQLSREEAAAGKKSFVRFADRGDGTLDLHARMEKTTGLRLKTYLEGYAQPRRQERLDVGQSVDYERLLADGLAELLEHLDPAALPRHGGEATTVYVTIDEADLHDDLAAADLGFEGDRISAGGARRLACNAGIIPVMLGSDSEVLDLGRTVRLHTPAQRKAIRLRDQVCRADGCQTPAPWCHVHHLTPWSEGGHTTVDDAVLLCGHHHRLIHTHTHATDRMPNGDIRFHRRE